MATILTIKPSDIHLSHVVIESGLWAIERYLMGKYGCDAASRDVEPLRWYITTGRASGYYLHHLLACKPYMIARQLHKGGSYDQVLGRVKQYMSRYSGYTEEG